MIELHNLTKIYNGLSVVSNVSFCVAGGESIALVGGSGSGKTTTLKMINRLIKPSKGRVLIDGKDTKNEPLHLLRRRIGYVFQKVGLFPHMSIAENISVPMKLAKWDKKRIKNRIEELLELVSLPSWMQFRKPPELSGGQQQRVGVARALATEPQLMLLDEPFGALDPIIREQLQHTFLELKVSLSLTAIFVTHDISEAFLIADRIAVMKDGRLLQLGSAQELINNPKDDYVEQLLDTPRRQTKAFDDLYPESKA
jgi:osmoprotectant transport system ATP-binding protein